MQSVVPRTTKVNRMESNLDLFSFDLSDAEMQQLDALDGSVQLVAS
jgi:diketogulonate reductase-like aldo/keto reductase